MFIESGGEIAVEVYYKKGKNGTIKVKVDAESIPEKEKEAWTKASFTLKPLTWKQHNDIQRAATVNRGPGMGSDLDWVLYKERKLVTILKSWDAKDSDGKAVPVNQENIFKLCPQVAEALLNEFDKATVLGDEERGN
jgi:hypothetical protein